jgi:hypothetical protein
MLAKTSIGSLLKVTRTANIDPAEDLITLGEKGSALAPVTIT